MPAKALHPPRLQHLLPFWPKQSGINQAITVYLKLQPAIEPASDPDAASVTSVAPPDLAREQLQVPRFGHA